MSDILRIYDPAECDERGVPLDWERCRRCNGRGTLGGSTQSAIVEPWACPVCDGHGSLKAAALARKWDSLKGCGYSAVDPPRAYRCESCSHPMSEGTWAGAWPGSEPEGAKKRAASGALADLRDGREPEPRDGWSLVHYSPCDEGCTHGGPGCRTTADGGWLACDGPRMEVVSCLGEQCLYFPNRERCPRGCQRSALIEGVEASWRQVDVRTLGWPHDLRPEKLAVLCLRCYAERSA